MQAAERGRAGLERAAHQLVESRGVLGAGPGGAGERGPVGGHEERGVELEVVDRAVHLARECRAILVAERPHQGAARGVRERGPAGGERGLALVAVEQRTDLVTPLFGLALELAPALPDEAL